MVVIVSVLYMKLSIFAIVIPENQILEEALKYLSARGAQKPCTVLKLSIFAMVISEGLYRPIMVYLESKNPNS